MTKQTIDSSRIPSLPGTSLIIPSRNRPEFLLATVESLLQGDEVPSELIIVDQSKAPNPTIVNLTTHRTCEIRYLWTQFVGLSRANNRGIAAARHDLLIFTHDDVVVTAAWFGTLVQALLAAEMRSVVTGQVRLTEAERPGGFQLTIKVDEAPAVYEGRVGKDVLLPLNMAMYRSAAAEVGGFDVRLGPGTPFPGAEDNDLGLRLLEAGYRIIYVPEAVLYHRAWRTGEDYISLRWSYGRGQGAFYAKYLNLQDRYMLGRLGQDVGHYAYLFFWGLRHQRHRAYGHGMYVLGILSGAIQWLLTQRKMR
jgi:GT2 family glycosyltransferase